MCTFSYAHDGLHHVVIYIFRKFQRKSFYKENENIQTDTDGSFKQREKEGRNPLI